MLGRRRTVWVLLLIGVVAYLALPLVLIGDVLPWEAGGEGSETPATAEVDDGAVVEEANETGEPYAEGYGETAAPPGATGSVGAVPVAGATGASGTTAAGGEPAVILSGLRLTHASIAALAPERVQVSQVRFAFTLSRAAEVRVRLARASARAGEVRWLRLADSLTLAAARGAHQANLHAASSLGAGLYRLTLSATQGGTRSLLIRVGEPPARRG